MTNLETMPGLFLVWVGLLGLAFGSFLNVVIYRLPVMLERSWRRECIDFLELEQPELPTEPFNLMVPGSRCPHCARPIRALENVPVLSYLLLRGRCAGCTARISVRYPAVELLTAALAVAVAARFGVSLQTLAGLGLTFALIPLCFIDLDHHLLPDSMTLPLLWCGLFLSLFDVFVESHASIVGAIAGYLSLWTVYHLFRLLTGREGMGHGDFKLLAALGAWLGWAQLPLIILIASILGAVVGIGMILLRRHDRHEPIPFGPFLAGAGWFALLFGNSINDAYWSIALR